MYSSLGLSPQVRGNWEALSAQFSLSDRSYSSRPHGLQHARSPCPSPTPSQSLLKLMSVESVMPSNHLILCCPLLLLPSIFPSIKVFSKESVLPIRWPKCLTSFRMDWLDLLAVQGTLKSLLQQFKSISSLALSFLFIVQLSHPYMTTGKTIALTRWTFVSKVMSVF